MPMRSRLRAPIVRRPRAARPRFGGLAALVVALGLALAHLGALAHFAVIRHVVCEHGALTHDEHGVDARVQASAGSKQASHATAPRDDARRDANAPAGSEHDHCDGNALTHRVDHDAAPHIGEASLVAVALAPPCGPRPEARALAPLAVAPKSSPPASAG